MALGVCSFLIEPGPRTCFSCYMVTSLTLCNDVDACREDEVCFLQTAVHNDVMVYSAGCRLPETCQAKAILMTSSPDTGETICQQCCRPSLCNKDLCADDVHPMETTASTETTSSPSPPATLPTVVPSSKTMSTSSTSPTVGVRCEVCNGGLCGVVPGVQPLMTCPATSPFCLNTVHNDARGSRTISKRCGSSEDCESMWWLSSSDQEVCVNLNVDDFYPLSFTCSYCCVRDGCNTNVHPKTSTLYMGTDQ